MVTSAIKAALAVAGDHLRHEHPELRFGVLNWWTLTPAVSAETLADGEDVHANRAETSLLMAHRTRAGAPRPTATGR